MNSDSSAASVVKSTYLTFAVIIIVWIGAWLLKVSLDNTVTWLTTSLGSFVYWFTAKIVIWILPAFWLLRISNRSVAEVFAPSRWKAWLTWGGA